MRDGERGWFEKNSIPNFCPRQSILKGAMGVVLAPVSGYQDDLEWLTNVCYLAKHFAVHTITTGLFDRNVFTRLFKRVQLGAFETDTLALVRCWRGLHFFAVRP